MPTVKPRLQITLEPDQMALLTRLAALRGTSRAAIVVELLEVSLPVLARVERILATAAAAPAEALKQLRQQMDVAESDAQHLMSEALGQVDAFADLLDQARAAADGRAAPAAADPRLSNTGVNPPRMPGGSR